MNGSHRQSVGESAAQLARARLTATPLTEFPGVLPTDLTSAYECQQAALRHWPIAGPADRDLTDLGLTDLDRAVLKVAGWKVARIGPEWRQQFPEERLIGPILPGRLYRHSPGQVIECPVIDGGFAAVEAELGIFVRIDAPADKQDWTSDSAATMVGQLCIGVEIASSPLASINDLGPGGVISDFGNNWGAIAGADLKDWRVLREPLEVQTAIDGVVVGRAATVVSAAPLDAFAFALNKAAKLRLPLRAGQYLSTGMITGVHDIRVGQTARVTFGENGSRGEILCRMVRSQPITSQAPPA